MLKNLSILGLLSVATLGMVAMPASADTAVVQQSTQDILIEGDGNRTIQSTQQMNQIRRDRAGAARRDNSGVVQDVYQGGTVIGDDNRAYQENTQINVIQERNRPSQNNGRGRGHQPKYRGSSALGFWPSGLIASYKCLPGCPTATGRSRYPYCPRWGPQENSHDDND